MTENAADLVHLFTRSFLLTLMLSPWQDRKSAEKGKPDDYDVLVRELMFEKKGAATDRLKTEEEIAKAEMVRWAF